MLILSQYCHKAMIRNLNFPKIITVRAEQGIGNAGDLRRFGGPGKEML